jgi:hypothetical protein
LNDAGRLRTRRLWVPRFGASSLANDILMQLVKEATGQYQSADYFSVD